MKRISISRKWIIAGGTVSLLLIGGGIYRWYSRSDVGVVPAFDASLVARRPETSNAGTCEPQYALKVGESYRFSMERAVQLQDARRQRPEGASRLGKLILSAVTSKGGETDVHARWLSTLADGGEIEGVFSINARGELRDWRWVEGTSTASRKLLVDLVETWAIPAPRFKNQSRVPVKHLRSDGREEAYVAEFKAAIGKNERQCRYELKRESPQTAQGPFQINVQVSQHQVRFFGEKESGMPASASGADRVSLRMGASALTVDVRYRLQLEARLKSSITASTLKHFMRFDAAAESAPLWETAFFPDGVREWGALKEAFSKIDAADVAARASWTAELRIALKRDPALAKSIAEFAIAQNSSQAPGYRAALAALAGSGTPEAQGAMQSLYRQGDALAKRQVLHQFSVVEGMMTEDSQRFLAATLASSTGEGNLGVPAGLALGASLSRSYRSEIAAQVEMAYRRAKDPVKKAAAIEMMGNSGRVEFLKPIREAASSKNPVLRESAASAFRKIPSESAQAALVEMARKDNSSQVRLSAVRSLGQRPFDRQIASVLDQCLDQEKNDSVKAACIGVFQEFAVTSAEARKRWNHLPPSLRGNAR